MDFGFGTFALGYLAGILSTLSPCVLPLLPILVATSLSTHRFGVLGLAAGLSISFTVIGLFIATIGVAIGLDQAVMRTVASIFMVIFGLVLLLPRLREHFTAFLSRFGNPADGILQRISGDGWGGQFLVGLLLGLVWAPCVGPTLGATTALAVQGTQLPQVALLMLLFGIGAGTPLMLLGTVLRGASNKVSNRLKSGMRGGGRIGNRVLGTILLLIGLSILTGLDRSIETFVVDVSPAWLTNLTTRY